MPFEASSFTSNVIQSTVLGLELQKQQPWGASSGTHPWWGDRTFTSKDKSNSRQLEKNHSMGISQPPGSLSLPQTSCTRITRDIKYRFGSPLTEMLTSWCKRLPEILYLFKASQEGKLVLHLEGILTWPLTILKCTYLSTILSSYRYTGASHAQRYTQRVGTKAWPWTTWCPLRAVM